VSCPAPSLGSPRVGHGDEGVDPARLGVDAPGRGVPGDRHGHGAVAELGEGVSFGDVALTHVVAERDDEVGATFEQSDKSAAGADGGQLAVVAHQHQGGTRTVDCEGDTGEVGVVSHAGFVDQHDGALVEDGLAVVEAPQ